MHACLKNSVPRLGRFVLFSTEVDVLNAPAKSLFYDRPFDLARPEVEKSFLGRLVLRIGGYYGQDSRMRRGANNLYDAVVEQAENAGFYQHMQLEMESFAAVHNVLGLHVWMLIGRLKGEEGQHVKKQRQLVYDQFLRDVELRVHKAGVRVRASQKLEDLERKFYGRCMAYDASLGKDARETFAEALLRNVYDAEKDKIQASKMLERYLIREIECLRLTDSTAVLQGRIKFTSLS